MNWGMEILCCVVTSICQRFDWKTLSTCLSGHSFSSLFLAQLQNSLKQVIESPTRRRGNDIPSLIDLVIVNINTEIVNITHLDPLGKSDHDVISWEIVTTVKKTENSPR